MSGAIDLNADLGEGFGAWTLGDDAGLLAVVTSANVACGFHAGDPSIMRRVCERAVASGVRIGAHVSYRDLAGFGRRAIEYEPDELTADLVYQIGALDGFARAAGDRVRYVKAHGALYNRVAHDERQAAAVVEAVRIYDRALPLLGLPDSAQLRLAAAAGLRPVSEAFADRAYTASGTLAPRGQPGAVLHDPDAICERSLQLARGEPLRTLDGGAIALQARSLCVHGDTPGAVAIAVRVRQALQRCGIAVEAFA